MFAVDLDTPGNDSIRPFIIRGDIPDRFREMTRRRLLAGAEAAAEHSLA